MILIVCMLDYLLYWQCQVRYLRLGGTFHLYYRTFLTRSGLSKMVSVTGAPAACSAVTLPCAVPVLPEMIAPACPIRFPGGAVRPEIKATTGFFMVVLMYSAASSSSLPPISPHITTALVCGSFSKSFR